MSITAAIFEHSLWNERTIREAFVGIEALVERYYANYPTPRSSTATSSAPW